MYHCWILGLPYNLFVKGDRCGSCQEFWTEYSQFREIFSSFFVQLGQSDPTYPIQRLANSGRSTGRPQSASIRSSKVQCYLPCRAHGLVGGPITFPILISASDISSCL